MTCAFIDGFEADALGTKYITYTGTPTIITGRDSAGSAAQLANPSAIVGQVAAAAEHATFIVGFAALFTGATTGQIATLRSDSGATIHIAVEWNGTSLVFKRGAAGTTLGTAAVTIPLNEWRYVEIRCVLHDTTGQLSCRVGNSTVLTLTGIDTKNAGTKTVFDSFGFQNAGSSTWRLDDLYVLNGAGAVNNAFLGDTRIKTLLPDGNGNYSQLVGSDGNSTDNYLLVDDPTSPSMTDYVGSETVGNKDTYPFGNLVVASPSAVAAVQTTLYAHDIGTGLGGRPVYRIAGTDYTGSDIALSAVAATYRQITEASPATAVAWTETEINAAEFGFEVRT